MFKFNIPDGTSISNTADWTELYMAYQKDYLSKSQLSSYLRESLGADPDEDFLQNVWKELERRLTLYGNSPPFRVEDKGFISTINWKDYPEYMACLIFSLTGNPSNSADSGKLFEQITNEAVKNYLGGNSIIYGHPRNVCVSDICSQMNEKFNYNPPKRRKDRDLDVIIWKPFGDSRASQIVVLIQCAAGNNWPTKLKDLNLEAWKTYIHFACHPIKGFSVPVIVENDCEQLIEMSRDAGLFIDRSRLYRNIISFPQNTALKRNLKSWCTKRLKQIGVN